MHCLLSITGNRTIAVRALIDTGAGGKFIDTKYATLRNIPLLPLNVPIPVYNIDKTPNKEGTITHYVDLSVNLNNLAIPTQFFATALRDEAMIIGLPWMQCVNPHINFRRATITIDPDDVLLDPMIPIHESSTTSLANTPSPVQAPLMLSSVPPPSSILKKEGQTNREKKRVHFNVPKVTIEDVPDEPTLFTLYPQKETPIQRTTTDPEPTSLHSSLASDDLILSKTSMSDQPISPSIHAPPNNDLLVAFIQGEPVIGIFEPDPVSDESSTTTPSLPVNSISFSVNQNLFINKTSNPAMSFAQAAAPAKAKTLEQMVSEQYLSFREVFEKKAAKRLSAHQPWDHAINLKPSFAPKRCKIYLLSPREEQAMNEFVDDNLRKGYIQPS